MNATQMPPAAETTALAETTAKKRPWLSCPKWMSRSVWQVIIIVIGVATIIAGIVMLIVPGPGLLAIYAGVGILATEFIWARKLFTKLGDWAKQVYARVHDWFYGTAKAEKPEG